MNHAGAPSEALENLSFRLKRTVSAITSDLSQDPPPPKQEAADHDPRASTIPLDTEDGGTVVIEQQNVGPCSQVGGGEYKSDDEVAVHESPEQAAAEQEALQRQAPADSPDDR
jgi:hypothetical protein